MSIPGQEKVRNRHCLLEVCWIRGKNKRLNLNNLASQHKSQHAHSHTQHRMSSARGSKSNRCHTTTYITDTWETAKSSVMLMSRTLRAHWWHCVIYTVPSNAKWAVSRKCRIVRKKESQVTQKEPWHNAASESCQKRSRAREWMLTGLTSGWPDTHR